jgi:hypothetical protein
MATFANTLPLFKMPDGSGYMTVVGLAAWLHNTYVVSIPPTGKSQLYCQTHLRLFKPTDTCPECNSQSVNVPNSAGVRSF